MLDFFFNELALLFILNELNVDMNKIIDYFDDKVSKQKT